MSLLLIFSNQGYCQRYFTIGGFAGKMSPDSDSSIDIKDNLLKGGLVALYLLPIAVEAQLGFLDDDYRNQGMQLASVDFLWFFTPYKINPYMGIGFDSIGYKDDDDGTIAISGIGGIEVNFLTLFFRYANTQERRFFLRGEYRFMKGLNSPEDTLGAFEDFSAHRVSLGLIYRVPF